MLKCLVLNLTTFSMLHGVRLKQQSGFWSRNTLDLETGGVPMKDGLVSPTTRLVQMCVDNPAKPSRLRCSDSETGRKPRAAPCLNTAENIERLTSWFPRYQHPRSHASKAEETPFPWVTVVTMRWQKNADALISSPCLDQLIVYVIKRQTFTSMSWRSNTTAFAWIGCIHANASRWLSR